MTKSNDKRLAVMNGEKSKHGPLWNWLHDDLLKDESKNSITMKKFKHRHQYEWISCVENCDHNPCTGYYCICGKKKPEKKG